MKSKGTAWLLWLLLGLVGGHWFYLGKPGKGILYLCTGGLFGIGWIFSMFKINKEVEFYNATHGYGARGGNANNNNNVNNIVINMPSQPQPQSTNTTPTSNN